MNDSLKSIIEAVGGLEVIVIGEAMLDSYLDGTAGRLCREAPALIVSLSHRRDMPGGAANTAVNVRALEGRPAFLSVVGDDPEGALLRRALEERGVSAQHLLVSRSRRTVTKNRLLAGSQMLVRFDQGSTEPLDEETEDALLERLCDLYPRSQAVIVSDYGYGILTPRVIRTLEELAARSPRTLVVDSKHLPAYRGARPTAVKPNYEEAALLLGLCLPDGASRAEAILARGEEVLRLTGARIAAVTLDVEGALVFEQGKPARRTGARPVSFSSAAGAGDTFVAALTMALASGADTERAAELASAAAAVVVGKPGTSSCSNQELWEYVSLGDKRVADVSRLAARAEFYRQQGRRVVFTNGCFDILHGGHINYLQRAKALGDVLIVGVNSDESVRRLKGPTRPINSLEDRLKVLAALSSVDHLIAFDEETPHELIRAVRPDTFVKGGDYTRETLPEASLVEELGGEVSILPYLEEHSTTGIIERIQKARHGPGRAASPPGGLPFPGPRVGPPPGHLVLSHRASAPALVEPAGRWSEARNTLCVRLDTLGDLLMTTPAIRALKESRPDRRITLLTSPSGAEVAALVPEIEEVLTYEAPWMKHTSRKGGSGSDREMAERLRREQFDSAVIFTVYSQSPLPAAFLCHLAEIPLLLGHCRENPYQLFTHWVAETEPESGVRHEVRRQLDLVAAVGCRAADERLSLRVPEKARRAVARVLKELELGSGRPWAVIHPGASAPSRRYPPESFAAAARALFLELGCPAVFTGTSHEGELVEEVRAAMGVPSHSLVGRLDLGELGALISMAPLLISNNTGPVHVAAAVGTPVVDLYALTNAQHTPWGVPCRVLFHDVPCRYCQKSVCPEGHQHCLALVQPGAVVQAARELLEEGRGLAPAGAAARPSRDGTLPAPGWKLKSPEGTLASRDGTLAVEEA